MGNIQVALTLAAQYDYDKLKGIQMYPRRPGTAECLRYTRENTKVFSSKKYDGIRNGLDLLL